MQRKGLLATAYLAAIAAGAIARQPWRETPTVESSPVVATQASAAVAEIQRQLDAKTKEALANRQAEALHEEQLDKAPPKTREEDVRDALRYRDESVQEDKRSLANLLARSHAFQATADLQPILTDALRAEDSMAEAAAIFLEWYRRDPQAAFAEYARRPLMERIFNAQECLFLQFSPEEIAAQVSLLRPDAFKDKLMTGMAWRFSYGNDLAGLTRMMEKLPADHQKDLAEDFARSNWVPEDGTAAVAFMANEMPVEVRKSLLRELAGCESYSFVSSLVMQTLGQEEVTRIADQIAHQPTGSGCCGGGDDDDSWEITPLEPGLSEEEVEPAIYSRLQAAFHQSVDYRECFGEETMGAAEIMAEIRCLIPGNEAYAKELHRGLYAELARYQPAAAYRWATAHMSPDELAGLNLRVLSAYDDSRTSRLAELLRDLPVDAAGPERIEFMAEPIATKFAAWRALDPEAARRAVDAIPKNHPLRRAAAGETSEESQ